MNDNTTKLIEQLAEKMGTTSEYLWGILIRQAPISASIYLFFIILTTALVIVSTKAHIHFNNDDNEWSYYKKGESLIFPMVIIFFCCLLSIIGCLLNINDIINGYFNPEFWALDYITGQLN